MKIGIFIRGCGEGGNWYSNMSLNSTLTGKNKANVLGCMHKQFQTSEFFWARGRKEMQCFSMKSRQVLVHDVSFGSAVVFRNQSVI